MDHFHCNLKPRSLKPRSCRRLVDHGSSVRYIRLRDPRPTGIMIRSRIWIAFPCLLTHRSIGDLRSGWSSFRPVYRPISQSTSKLRRQHPPAIFANLSQHQMVNILSSTTCLSVHDSHQLWSSILSTLVDSNNTMMILSFSRRCSSVVVVINCAFIRPPL